MVPNFAEWRRYAEASLAASKSHGGDNLTLAISPPTTPAGLRIIENQLGQALPASFRRVVTKFAAAFELSWFLPDERKPPFRGIFCGQMSWNVERLVTLEEGRRGWVRNVFPDPENSYDRVWHDKLAIHEVGNGDLLALDLVAPGNPLVYLSHDDGEGHGYALGSDFCDAMSRWTRLGCVGAEDWQWLPFVSGPSSGLIVDGDNARRWRDWFGIDRHLG
jgi:hypothetical protein